MVGPSLFLLAPPRYAKTASNFFNTLSKRLGEFGGLFQHVRGCKPTTTLTPAAFCPNSPTQTMRHFTEKRVAI